MCTSQEMLSGGGAQQLKLLAWLHRHMAAHYPVSKDAGAESGVMHRLDAETSGVLLCAKSYAGTHWLRLQWALHDVTKEYVALVHGWVDPATVEVRRRLRVETRGASSHCAVAADGSGQPAFTEVATLAHLSRAAAGIEGGSGAGEEERYSLVALKIHTGKTHQIRVHMLSLGHPRLRPEVCRGSLRRRPRMVPAARPPRLPPCVLGRASRRRGREGRSCSAWGGGWLFPGRRRR